MRLDDLIYTRETWGKDGIPIKIYKIRTMIPNANENLQEVLNEGIDTYGNPINDPRITRVGRFLRRYWIDEFPQIYNLLRRDIKVVGIRPLEKSFWELYPPELKEEALKQRPGLIGVQYAHRDYKRGEDFDTCISIFQKYLRESKSHPLWTDTKYFFKIMFNIIFRGVRSS